MGSKQAIVALAHRILIIIYHLLDEQQSEQKLGLTPANEHANESSKRWTVRTLKQLGYDVTLQMSDTA